MLLIWVYNQDVRSVFFFYDFREGESDMKIKKRLITAAASLFVLFSFAACDTSGLLINTNKEETTATSVTTAVEVTTTSEETTATVETTTEETTATESETTTTTTTVETTPETKATPVPTKKPAKVSSKPTYIPKGWYKEDDAWGIKYKGKKAYVIESGDSYKGWYNGKWVRLYQKYSTIDDVGNYFVEYFRDKKHKKKYCEYEGAP